MSLRLNTRLATLEKAITPKAGIADAIRQAYREIVAGIPGHKMEGGRIAAAIRADRAAKVGDIGR